MFSTQVRAMASGYEYVRVINKPIWATEISAKYVKANIKNFPCALDSL